MNGNMNVPAKTSSDIVRKSYGDEEINHIYELARFHLENGAIKLAEPIFKGLVEVRPDFAPGWLGMSYVRLMEGDFDHGLQCAQRAHKAQPESVEALLLQVTCLLSLDDLNGAGTLLGEVGDRVDGGEISQPHILRFYRAQLARYQSSR